MPTIDFPFQLAELAIAVARDAGVLAREARSAALDQISTKSSPTDVVTAADHAVEERIVSQLTAARPDDAIVGEESTHDGVYPRVAAHDPGGISWIVDPIDGTVNYLYGIEHYAVSIAAYQGDEPVAGVVYKPATEQLWSAIVGAGSWAGAPYSGERLRGSSQTELSQALIGTGFSYDAARRAEQGRIVASLLPRVRDIRRIGSAALDLCYVAQGLFDAYYESGLQHWDGAAGSLIATEAGLKVSGLHGEPWGSQMTIAAPLGLHEILHDTLVTLGA